MLAYAADVGKDKISSHLVWLEKDTSAAESFLTQRLRRYLGPTTSAGVSLDGGEGPGAYALNREVALTVVVGTEHKVTANFALVQPSDRDAPKVLAEVAKLIGVAPPAQKDLAKYRPQQMAKGNGRIRGWLRRILKSEVDEDGVKKQIAHLQQHVEKNPRLRPLLGKSLAQVLNRKGFDQRGTKAAREQLRALAKKYPPPPPSARDTDKPRRPTREEKTDKKTETDKTPDDKGR